MTLSKKQKKYAHALLIGFASGGLSYLSAILVGAELPGIRALLVGAFTAGLGRVAGHLVDILKTTDSPNVPPSAETSAAWQKRKD